MKKLLIGGKALMKLGSTRNSLDTDYLVSDATRPVFDHDAVSNTDYINAAAGNDFFAAIWKNEANNNGEIATAQSLLELKAYALVQHCKNGFWQKADDAEYDMKFLCRQFNLTEIPTIKNFVSPGEYAECMKIIKSVKK